MAFIDQAKSHWPMTKTRKNPKLTADRARSLFEYDPGTGIVRNKVGRGRVRAGDLAGWVRQDGYHVIVVDGEPYTGHRIAWLLAYGEHAKEEIDHINGRTADNRLANLRLASRAQNNRNVRVRKDNSSGFKGVSWHKAGKKWSAYIRVNGRTMALGLFHSIEEARNARVEAERVYFGEFIRTS
jgi:hypothetical protein